MYFSKIFFQKKKNIFFTLHHEKGAKDKQVGVSIKKLVLVGEFVQIVNYT